MRRAKLEPGKWMSVMDAAIKVGVHEVTFRRWIREGKVKIRRHVLVPGSKRAAKIEVSAEWVQDTVSQQSVRVSRPVGRPRRGAR